VAALTNHRARSGKLVALIASFCIFRRADIAFQQAMGNQFRDFPCERIQNDAYRGVRESRGIPHRFEAGIDADLFYAPRHLLYPGARIFVLLRQQSFLIRLQFVSFNSQSCAGAAITMVFRSMHDASRFWNLQIKRQSFFKPMFPIHCKTQEIDIKLLALYVFRGLEP
jgi:hypothetical protein